MIVERTVQVVVTLVGRCSALMSNSRFNDVVLSGVDNTRAAQGMP
jgi:hypothetical protein